MSRVQILLIGVAAAALALTVAAGQRAVATAEAERVAAYTHLTATRGAIAELDRLASVRDAVPAARRPDADLIGGVRGALRRAGVPERAFLGLQHRDDRQLASSRVRVQRVQLRLGALRLTDVGRFLATWRTDEHPWRVVEYQMTHAGRGDAGRYQVSLVLAAPYLALGAAGAPSPPAVD